MICLPFTTTHFGRTAEPKFIKIIRFGFASLCICHVNITIIYYISVMTMSGTLSVTRVIVIFSFVECAGYTAANVFAITTTTIQIYINYIVECVAVPTHESHCVSFAYSFMRSSMVVPIPIDRRELRHFNFRSVVRAANKRNRLQLINLLLFNWTNMLAGRPAGRPVGWQTAKRHKFVFIFQIRKLCAFLRGCSWAHCKWEL